MFGNNPLIFSSSIELVFYAVYGFYLGRSGMHDRLVTYDDARRLSVSYNMKHCFIKAETNEDFKNSVKVCK